MAHFYVQTEAVFKGTNDSLPANIVWLERENYYLPVGRTANIDPTKERKVIKRSLEMTRKDFQVSLRTPIKWLIQILLKVIQ